MGSCSWRFTLAVSFELTNSSWLMMGLKGIGISFHLSIDYGPVVLQLKMDNISLFWPKSRQFSRGKIYHFVKRAYFAFIGQLFLSISGDFLKSRGGLPDRDLDPIFVEILSPSRYLAHTWLPLQKPKVCWQKTFGGYFRMLFCSLLNWNDKIKPVITQKVKL